MLGKNSFEIAFVAKSEEDLKKALDELKIVKDDYNKYYLKELIGERLDKYTVSNEPDSVTYTEKISNWFDSGLLEPYFKAITPYIEKADAIFYKNEVQHSYHFNMNNSKAWSKVLGEKKVTFCYGNMSAEIHFNEDYKKALKNAKTEDEKEKLEAFFEEAFTDSYFNVSSYFTVDNTFYCDFCTDSLPTSELYDILKEIRPYAAQDSFVLIRDEESKPEDNKYRKIYYNENCNDWISVKCDAKISFSNNKDYDALFSLDDVIDNVNKAFGIETEENIDEDMDDEMEFN